MSDDFFQPLENTKPYLKIGLLGFAGSGKTHTGALIAIGLHKRIQSEKPVVIFDTERAAKFLQPLFEAEGIRVLVRDSRSLADLTETMKRCRDGLSDVLVIDSITHCYEHFIESYRKKRNKNRLDFADWGVLKPTWKAEFSDPFVRDPYHIVMTGRAGYEYSDERNEETGKREIYKSGIKMKAEAETAYEPDLLVLMERDGDVLGDKKSVWREAMVLKDRSTLIDGKTFRDPSYADFAPAIELILKDPAARAPTAEGDAAALVKTEDDKREWVRAKEIALEKVQAYMVEVWPGQSAAEKKTKVQALNYAYGTTSWKEVETFGPDHIRKGLEKLREFAQKQVSREPGAEG